MYYLFDSTTNVEDDIPQPNTQPEELQDVAAGSIPDAQNESTDDFDYNNDSCPLSDAPVESEDELSQLDAADSGEQYGDLDAEIEDLPGMY